MRTKKQKTKRTSYYFFEIPILVEAENKREANKIMRKQHLLLSRAFTSKRSKK